MNKVVKGLMLVAVFAAVCASNGYAQEAATSETTSLASPGPPAAYVNVSEGYKIVGKTVFAMPVGSLPYTNVALGFNSLTHNTTGIQNVALGTGTLTFNTTGESNTAIGQTALNNNEGSGNTAVGFDALYSNETGLFNIAIGVQAGFNIASESNNIDIGSQGAFGDSGAIRIGCVSSCYPGTQTSAYIAGIAGVTLPVANEPLVCVDPSTGQLGTVNCASNGAPSAQLEMLGHRIELLQKQNDELRQRLSRLESLIAKR